MLNTTKQLLDEEFCVEGQSNFFKTYIRDRNILQMQFYLDIVLMRKMHMKTGSKENYTFDELFDSPSPKILN